MIFKLYNIINIHLYDKILILFYTLGVFFCGYAVFLIINNLRESEYQKIIKLKINIYIRNLLNFLKNLPILLTVCIPHTIILLIMIRGSAP